MRNPSMPHMRKSFLERGMAQGAYGLLARQQASEHHDQIENEN